MTQPLHHKTLPVGVFPRSFQGDRPEKDAPTARDHLVCGGVTIGVFAQLLVFGANSTFLATLATLLNLGLCAGVLVLLRAEEDSRFWGRLAALAIPFGVAWLLGAAPLVFNTGPDDMMVSRDRVILELFKLAGVAAMTLSGALIMRKKSRLVTLMTWIAVTGFLWLVLAIALWRTDDAAVLGEPKEVHLYRFTATLFNANAAACVAACLVLISLGVGYTALRKVEDRTRFESWVGVGAAGLCFALAGWAVLLTASRTALIGLGLAITGFVVLSALRGRGEKTLGGRDSWLLLGGFGVLLGIAAIGGAPTIGRHFESDDVDIRLAAWRIALSSLSEAPWLGRGLGNFSLVHQSHLTPQTAAAIWDMNAAHQAVLQAALEGGAPFALLLSGIVIWILIRAAIAWWTPRNGRWAALAAILSVLLILFCGAFDIAMNVPAIASLFGLLIGALWGWSSPSASQRAATAGSFS